MYVQDSNLQLQYVPIRHKPHAYYCIQYMLICYSTSLPAVLGGPAGVGEPVLDGLGLRGIGELVLNGVGELEIGESGSLERTYYDNILCFIIIECQL